MEFGELNRVETLERLILLILLLFITLFHALRIFKACSFHLGVVLARRWNWDTRTLVERLLECRGLVLVVGVDGRLSFLFERGWR